jgi:hypothetical protein
MEEETELSKTEARERFEALRREVVTMEWDIEHHGLKLKQELYDRKKVELESLKKLL